MSSLLDQLTELHREEVNAALGKHANLKSSFIDDHMGNKVAARQSKRKTELGLLGDSESLDVVDIEQQWLDIPVDEHVTIPKATNDLKPLYTRDIALRQSTDGIQLDTSYLAPIPEQIESSASEKNEEEYQEMCRGWSIESGTTVRDVPSRSTSCIRVFRIKKTWLERTRLSCWNKIPLKLIIEHSSSHAISGRFTYITSRRTTITASAAEQACVLHPESKRRIFWTLY